MSRVVLEELGRQDLMAVEAVFAACEDYFVLATGRPPPPRAADSLFIQLPEGCCYEDKHILGICDPDTRELLGLIDAIVGHPDLRTLTLGLFLITPEGLRPETAQEAFRLLEQWARARGLFKIRVTGNDLLQGTARFFERAGFRATQEPAGWASGKVVTLEKHLLGTGRG